MSTRLPIEVNPFRLIEQRRELDGEFPIKNFSRIADLLVDNEGVIEAKLSFGKNELNLPSIRGHLTGQINLVCQRCMEAVTYTIDNPIDLVMVTSDEAAERLQGSHETYLVVEGRIFLQDFVEDEILLNIPQMVMHDQCEPQRPLIEALPETVSQTLEEEKENPFAMLQNLKKPGNLN
jgi:uncharacterized protein